MWEKLKGRFWEGLRWLFSSPRDPEMEENKKIRRQLEYIQSHINVPPETPHKNVSSRENSDVHDTTKTDKNNGKVGTGDAGKKDGTASAEQLPIADLETSDIPIATGNRSSPSRKENDKPQGA